MYNCEFFFIFITLNFNNYSELDLYKYPDKYCFNICFVFLGKYWKSLRMAAMPRGCALAGAQLQEETETVSALASLTVDVEQPFAEEDNRYEHNTGRGSLLSVTSRLIISAREPLSRRLLT